MLVPACRRLLAGAGLRAAAGDAAVADPATRTFAAAAAAPTAAADAATVKVQRRGRAWLLYEPSETLGGATAAPGVSRLQRLLVGLQDTATLALRRRPTTGRAALASQSNGSTLSAPQP
jgi:hypothetical protein